MTTSDSSGDPLSLDNRLSRVNYIRYSLCLSRMQLLPFDPDDQSSGLLHLNWKAGQRGPSHATHAWGAGEDVYFCCWFDDFARLER